MLRLRTGFAALAAWMCILSGVAASAPAGPAPMSLRLVRGLTAPKVHAWVFFKDKGIPAASIDRELSRAQAGLSSRALWRRAKTMKHGLVDQGDLPVSDAYVAQVLATGATKRAVTRWLNGISVEATAAQLQEIRNLSCVSNLDLVAAGRRPDAPEEVSTSIGSEGEAAPQAILPRGSKASAVLDSTQYGVSWKQLKQIQVTKMHEAGYHGEGVLICMLDNGYKLTHGAFTYPNLGDSIHVAASRDFIHGDTVVVNQAGTDSVGQDSHGTQTTSTIGGYYPTRYIGAAYRARFMLGKTEWNPSESLIEEDYWLMGTEWADSLGADIISSSLGYHGMDNAATSHHFWNLDGHQAIATRAAEIAAYRGILVVVAMGNEGQLSGAYPDPQNKMGSPADADSIISSGAVDSNSVRSSFSSIGPTYDRRIKPDIMARGSLVWMVSTSSNSAYTRANGTSFSTPLTAGALALLLQKRPYYTPVDVITAVHATGDRSSNPDTLYGWGLLRVFDAANYPLAAAVGPDGPNASLSLALGQNRPNPFRDATRIDYSLAKASTDASLRVYDVGGRLVATLAQGRIDAGPHQALWDGRGSSGRAVAPGVYFAKLQSGSETSTRRLVRIQ